MAGFDEWYFEMPLITRLYLTASILTTGACALECVPILPIPSSSLAQPPRQEEPAL
jgi:hypothetical protein